MFFYDQRPSQWYHHQCTQYAAENGQDENGEIFKIIRAFGITQKQKSRQCKHYTGRNTFAGTTRSLDDIIFKDGSPQKKTAQSNGNYSNWYGSRNGQSGFECQVYSRGAEDDTEDGA